MHYILGKIKKYFLLVYNEGKNSCEKDGIEQQDSSKVVISKYLHNKAKKKYVRFGLDRFEKIYFKEVFTYTEKEFEVNFLSKIDDAKVPTCVLAIENDNC